MKIKNLVVADVMYPTVITQTSEIYTKVSNCILIKGETSLSPYTNVETNEKYSSWKARGFKYVDQESIKPLSDYYYRIGLKKKNNHKNQEEIYHKVKALKKLGIKL